MTPKIKNIIIFVTIAVVFILVYVFFIKSSAEKPGLVSSSGNTSLPNIDGSPAATNTTGSVFVTDDFLSLLSSVKKIKLDGSIFSDPAFISLHDSSITLTQDGTEGRPNPFAQFGKDVVVVVPPNCVLPQILDVATNTCLTPTPTCISPQVLDSATKTCVNPATN